jgi:hypothetical protein
MIANPYNEELIRMGVIREKPISFKKTVTAKYIFKGKKYLSYDDARRKIIPLKLDSADAWRKYAFGNYLGAGIPDNPDVVYYGRGWISYNHWLGIQEKLKTKKTSTKSKKIKKFTIVKKTRTAQKINTDKNKKFIELSEKRMPKTIKAIKLIGNLSNTSNYFYSEADSKKINKELKKAIKILKKNYLKN